MQPSPDDIALAGVLWKYMFFHTEPIKSDIIIGLGCHELTVADDAAELYRRGVAPLILFTGDAGRTTEGLFNQSEARMMRDRAVSKGVPKDAILIEEAATNTGENMRLSQQLLENKGIDVSRIVFVHPPYMLRRDYATFMKQWKGASDMMAAFWAKDIDFRQYLANADHDAAETISIIVGDVERLEDYPELGFEIPQTVPDEVKYAFKELIDRGYSEHLLARIA